MKQKKLYRSRNDRVLSGLCGGLSKYFNVDSTLVRIAFVILEFATGGLLIIGYIIVAAITPKEPDIDAGGNTVQ